MNVNGIPLQKIREALFYIDASCPRKEWVAIGMALYSELGETGFELFDSWSAMSPAYKPKDTKTAWKSCRTNRTITIGTLVHRARENGYVFNDDMPRISPKEIQARGIEQRKKDAVVLEQQEIATKDEVAKKARHIWNKSQPATEHAYLTSKGIEAHGLRLDAHKNLVVPMYQNGVIRSLQLITEQSEKRFLKDGEKSGSYYAFGDVTPQIYLCEGWATGATIYEATQQHTVCAFDAGNLVHVGQSLRKQYPQAHIVICADNDQYKKDNAGLINAYHTAELIDADVVYPVFRDTSDKPTDFNDLYNEIGSFDDVIETIEKPLFVRSLNTKQPIYKLHELKFIEKASKALEESIDPLTVARGAYWYAMQLAEQCPYFYSLNFIRDRINHPLIHYKTQLSIMYVVHKIVNRNRNNAMTAIKTKRIAKDHEHITVNTLENIQLNDGMNVIIAPMGTGKTKNVITPFSQENKQFMAIAHRRSLIAELANNLKVKNYDEKFDASLEDKIAVCLPSAISKRFTVFRDRMQNLAIDEISQCVRFTNSKECKTKDNDQEGIYFGTQKLVNHCDRVVVADASIDEPTLTFLEQARPEERFTVYEVLPQNKDKKIFTYDEEGLLSAINCELMNDGKVWVACESVASAEAIQDLFKERYKTILITSKNNTTKKVKTFLSNADKDSRNYDLVIASPAISSGVSVEHKEWVNGELVCVPHFTMIAGFANGSAICFSDFAQMLARVRYVPNYHICIKKNTHRNNGVTANTILQGKRQASQIEGNTAKDNEYSQITATLEALEMMHQANFANGFYWFMRYYCYEFLPPLEIHDYGLLDEFKEYKKNNKEKYHVRLCEAKILTKDEYEKLNSKKTVSEQEQDELMSYVIRHSMGLDDLCIQDVEMFEQLPKVDRFARLLGFVSKNDDTDKNISLRKFEKAQVIGINSIFPNNPADLFFTNDLCKEIIRNVSKDENRFMLSALKLIPSKYARELTSKQKIPIPDNCTKAMALVLDKFGLKWLRTTHNKMPCYTVTPESYENMFYYSQKRFARLS